MSNWGPKLDKKLNALADSASKESIQTLANWIGFNRKHAAAISSTLKTGLTSANATRQWLYWQVVHELLLMNHNSDKWDKLSELRTLLGEGTVIPAIESLGSNNVSSQLEPLLKIWDDHNVFGGPTLVGQIRRLLAAKPSASDEAEDVKAEESSSPAKAKEASPKAATATEKSSHEAFTPKDEEKPPVEKPEEISTTPAPARRISLSTVKVTEYDFESKNVPQGKVESREFLDPCKAIATLQIARDLRNDSAVQLHSLLSNLPADILEVSDKNDLDEATIRDFSIRIPTQLLDMDLEEQLQTVTTFRDIVRQQQTARKKLIFLLLKSRCQFGSNEAAKEFFELKETSQKLKRRRQLLSDALELEGLETEVTEDQDLESSLQDLPKLSWYNKGVDDELEQESASKKARIDE